jgi:fibulin 1/2
MLILIFTPADVNECESLNGGCAHICTNFEGGHGCSCRTGFDLEDNNQTCADLNECLDDPCNHTCVNLIGGYNCECTEGYVLDVDRVTCNGKCLPDPSCYDDLAIYTSSCAF